MTNERAAVIAQIVEMEPTDPAFRREWLDRGGHYYTFAGIPELQDQLRRELPLRYTHLTRASWRQA